MSEQRPTETDAGARGVANGGDVLSVVAFSLDRQRYGLPLEAAQRALPMCAVSPLPGCPDAVLGAINVHGDVVPVLDLRRRLGLESREYGPDARLLLARTATRTVALPVDEVHGVLDLDPGQVVAPSSVLPQLEQVAGVAALADGLLLINDLTTLLSIDEERQLDHAIGGPAG